jgi:hypothetical protein
MRRALALAARPVVTAAPIWFLLAVALNGRGLREQMHRLLLGRPGVPTGEAVAPSLLGFAHLLLGSVVGGLLWLRLRSAGPVDGVGA